MDVKPKLPEFNEEVAQRYLNPPAPLTGLPAFLGIRFVHVEPGLIRVQELWDSRDALDRHFAAPHMQAWLEQRAALGFCDRRISVAEIGRPAPL